MKIENAVRHIKSTAGLYGTVKNAGYKETESGAVIKVEIAFQKEQPTGADTYDSEGYKIC